MKNTNKEIAVKPNGFAVAYARDVLTEGIRSRVKEAIKEIVKEELDAALGAGSYERNETRRGYRNGTRPREITTSFGKTAFEMPRGVMFAEGREAEWQSTMLPRYGRRCKEVDAALLGMYFGGINTRRVKRALRPLLKNSPLSKSSISRLISRLKEFFEAWRQTDLSGYDIRYLYLDGLYVRTRCGGRITKMPVLAAVGVRSDGVKILLSLEMRGSEGEDAWKGFLESLTRRRLKTPSLVIADGAPGLSAALDVVWPKVDRQRCAVHKLRNLLSHAPDRLHEDIRADFHAIVYAEGLSEAQAAYERFLRKWSKLHESVARSLREAGQELLAFYRYPKSQWKSIRTTNSVERLNQEFRRRIKTQGSFPTESSVLIVLFGLVASGMVRMRRIEGYEDIASGANAERKAPPFIEDSSQMQPLAMAA